MRRQEHGFIFEEFCKKNLRRNEVFDTPEVLTKPISYKTIKIKINKNNKISGTIYLGDCHKQYDEVYNDFYFMILLYVRNGKNYEPYTILAVQITISEWKSLFGDIKLNSIVELENFIKSKENRNLSGKDLNDFRKQARDLRDSLIVNSNSKIKLNPKIDSKGQRRLQCSMNFSDFCNIFKIEIFKPKTKNINFFGKKFNLTELSKLLNN